MLNEFGSAHAKKCGGDAIGYLVPKKRGASAARYSAMFNLGARPLFEDLYSGSPAINAKMDPSCPFIDCRINCYRGNSPNSMQRSRMIYYEYLSV